MAHKWGTTVGTQPGADIDTGDIYARKQKLWREAVLDTIPARNGVGDRKEK
jgi:hypothetical protein